MKTDINGSGMIFLGGLVAVAVNPLIVNVESKVSWTINQTGAKQTNAMLGGLIGQTIQGGKIYKSSYVGSMQYTVGSSPISINGGAIAMGGITANTRSDNNAEYVIDQCYVSGLLQCTHYGACIGGLVGEPTWAGTTKVTITNNIISNLNVKMLGTFGELGSAGTYFNDAGLISGEDYWQTKANSTSYQLNISNIYITNSKVYRGSTDTAGAIILVGMENNGVLANVNSCSRNIVVQAASSEAIHPSYINSSTAHKKQGSVAGVVTEANKNSSITNNFSVSSSGAVTSKLSTFLSTL